MPTPDDVLLPVQCRKDGRETKLCFGDRILSRQLRRLINPLRFVAWPTLQPGDTVLVVPRDGDYCLVAGPPRRRGFVWRTANQPWSRLLRVGSAIRSDACRGPGVHARDARAYRGHPELRGVVGGGRRTSGDGRWRCGPIEALRGDYDGDEAGGRSGCRPAPHDQPAPAAPSAFAGKGAASRVRTCPPSCRTCLPCRSRWSPARAGCPSSGPSKAGRPLCQWSSLPDPTGWRSRSGRAFIHAEWDADGG